MVDESGPRPPADHEAQLKELIAAGRRGDAVTFFMRRTVGISAIFVAVMRLLPMWSRLKAVAYTPPYDAAIMGDFSLPTERIASVTVPTFVIGGEKSDVRLRHAVQQLADVLPNRQLRMLKGQSHNVSMKVFAPVLVELFEAQNGTWSGTPSAM